MIPEDVLKRLERLPGWAEVKAQEDMLHRIAEGRDPPENYQAGKCKDCGLGFFMKGEGRVPAYCGGSTCFGKGGT